MVFVQVCDVSSLFRTDCFGADTVTDCLLLSVHLAEGAVQVPLPVDLITVDLMWKNVENKFKHQTLRMSSF